MNRLTILLLLIATLGFFTAATLVRILYTHAVRAGDETKAARYQRALKLEHKCYLLSLLSFSLTGYFFLTAWWGIPVALFIGVIAGFGIFLLIEKLDVNFHLRAQRLRMK